MNKKLKIIIGIVSILILIFVITKIAKNNSSTEETEEETTVSDIKYDEETGEYYIEDEETGEILHTSDNEGDLYIYTIDPDYDPQNPDAVSDEYYEEELEEN